MGLKVFTYLWSSFIWRNLVRDPEILTIPKKVYFFYVTRVLKFKEQLLAKFQIWKITATSLRTRITSFWDKIAFEGAKMVSESQSSKKLFSDRKSADLSYENFGRFPAKFGRKYIFGSWRPFLHPRTLFYLKNSLLLTFESAKMVSMSQKSKKIYFPPNLAGNRPKIPYMIIRPISGRNRPENNFLDFFSSQRSFLHPRTLFYLKISWFSF